jgi:hypothetical protein
VAQADRRAGLAALAARAAASLSAINWRQGQNLLMALAVVACWRWWCRSR